MPQPPTRTASKKARKRRKKTQPSPQNDEAKFPSPSSSGYQTPEKQKAFHPNLLDGPGTKQDLAIRVSNNDNMDRGNPAIAEVDISDEEILRMWTSNY